VKIGLLIEAQEDLDWGLWRRVAKSADELGFDSLWRSDHLVALYGRKPGAASDALLGLAIAAEVTTRIGLGTMVASVTFRHPSALARQAAQIDALSGGRFTLGVGAGWHDGEHTEYGIDFPPIGERMDRLRETILYCRAVWGDGPQSFEGQHYRAQDVIGLPRPAQDPLPVLVGGSGERRTLRIVAELADEDSIDAEDIAEVVAEGASEGLEEVADSGTEIDASLEEAVSAESLEEVTEVAIAESLELEPASEPDSSESTSPN